MTRGRPLDSIHGRAVDITSHLNIVVYIRFPFLDSFKHNVARFTEYTRSPMKREASLLVFLQLLVYLAPGYSASYVRGTIVLRVF